MTTPTPDETRILLLRHAETSAPGFFHGSESDVGLGPVGFEQARRAAGRIAAERPQAVYSSGMRRAVETARPIALACGLPLLVSEGLVERRMGPMSGMSRSAGWSTYEETKEHWKAGRLDFTHDGGESFAAIRDRATSAFLGLLKSEQGKTVVVVAHGVLNRVLLTSLVEGYTPADFDRVPIDFVGVHDVRWDGSILRLAGYWAGDPTPPIAR
jgi:probable phosphoglycerate mutase